MVTPERKSWIKKVTAWATAVATVATAGYHVVQARNESKESKVNSQANFATMAPAMKEMQGQMELLIKWAEAHGRDYDNLHGRNVTHGEKIAKHDGFFEFLKTRNSGLERVERNAARPEPDHVHSGLGDTGRGGGRAGPSSDSAAEGSAPIFASQKPKKERPKLPPKKSVSKIPKSLDHAKKMYMEQMAK